LNFDIRGIPGYLKALQGPKGGLGAAFGSRVASMLYGMSEEISTSKRTGMPDFRFN